ncbi:SPW repeat protein [Priestia aryabhattai]|uniref:SPW repeat protein n=1 Tax=Priestia aryabhattai TaxID=412384 RepID=UPI003D2BEEF0
MKLRGNLNALIGLWFIIAPWAIGYSDQSGALWSSIVFESFKLLYHYGAMTNLAGIHGKIGSL